MKLLKVRTETVSGGIRFVGVIQRASAVHTEEVFYQFDDREMESATATADAFAAAMLIPAMRNHEDLEIVPPISPLLQLQLPRVRDLFHTWYPEYGRISIKTEAADLETRPPQRRAATFFSGGVDSYHTLLRHLNGDGDLPYPLTHVIFMNGVENRLDESVDVAASEALVRQTADHVGVKVLTGTTNLRSVLQGSEAYMRWGKHYHGSALASIGLAVSPMFDAVCIPSTYDYNHIAKFGSSPALDELFSTERTRILHDGAEAGRGEKVRLILEWERDLVLDTLRICWENSGGAANCGRCRKCVRTAVPLAALGVLDNLRLFQTTDKGHWVQVLSTEDPVWLNDALSFVLSNGSDPELLSILKRAQRRHDRLEPTQRMKDFVRPLYNQLRKYNKQPPTGIATGDS